MTILTKAELDFIGEQNYRARQLRNGNWTEADASRRRMEAARTTADASPPSSSLDDEISEFMDSLDAAGWHNAKIFGCATPLGQRIHFPERDGVEWSKYADNCAFDFDTELTTLQDSHDHEKANVLGLCLSFRVDDGQLRFTANRIPRNAFTDRLMDYYYANRGLSGLTCSLGARVLKSHLEFSDVGYPPVKTPVQVVDECFVDHVRLIAPWENEFPWKPLARAANTSAYIQTYR